LFCFIITATPLALQVHQERIRKVRGNKEALKLQTALNSTHAKGLGLGTDHDPLSFLSILDGEYPISSLD